MIAVCGEALIDVIRQRDGTQRTAAGGGPFNTARALARLGVPTAFVGRLSNDALGRELAELMVKDGVSLDLASTGEERTTIATADIDSSGAAAYQFQVDGTSAPHLTRAMLPDRLPPHVNAIHVGTLGMVLDPMASTLVDLVERDHEGRLVILDPNVRIGLIPDPVYRARLNRVISNAGVVKASRDDLEWLYPDAGYMAAVDRLLARGVRLVIVTLGEHGAMGAHAGYKLRVDPVPVQVVDTIGAGDAFGAAFLAWMHDHGKIAAEPRLDAQELRSALEYSCRAAAITCSRAGADPPWKSELSQTV